MEGEEAMKSLQIEADGSVRAMAGSHIAEAISEAIALSGVSGGPVAVEFNGVAVSVLGDSDPALIYRDWSRALAGYIGGTVGPYPAAALTEDEQANDARIEADNERKRRARQAEYEAAAATQRAATEAALKTAGALDLSNETAWQEIKDRNQDGYGGAVVSYAERWARLIQAAMSTGQKLEDVADTTSREADTDGITGFMYGCAVQMLARCWRHGDSLRRWHNGKYGVTEEKAKGGVVNPAILTVG